MPFNDPAAPIPLTYGDVFREAEAEYARWNFDVADTAMLLRHFEDAEAECARILAEPDIDPKTGRRIVMALPAYDQCIKASPPLQPARRPRRDLGHRAPGLHRPGARAGEDLRRRLRPGRRGGMTAPIRALRVHLGAHKTATTHLQQALHRHRDALGAADIDFLRPVELRPALRAAARLAARCPGARPAGSAPRSTGCGPAPAPSRSPRRTCPARSATSSTRSPTATSGRGWRRSPASPARRRWRSSWRSAPSTRSGRPPMPRRCATTPTIPTGSRGCAASPARGRRAGSTSSSGCAAPARRRRFASGATRTMRRTGGRRRPPSSAATPAASPR